MAGVEGYNSAGQLVFSETSYAGHFFGSFNTSGQQSGTYTDANLIGKRLLYFLPQNLGAYGGPNVTLDVNTGTMTWQYQVNVQGQGAPALPSDIVYYGGY